MKLNVPKGQTNSFGGYKYRSCEDILKALKPLLAEQKACLTITDDMVQLGDRYYVKAIVTFSVEKESVSVSGYAREALSKKGMDEAQITGAASSYARKYALSGLLAIDDTKDADTMDNTSNSAHKQPPQPAHGTQTQKPTPTTPTPEQSGLMAEIADAFKQAKSLMEIDLKVKEYQLKIAALPEDSKQWLRNECKSNQARIEAEIAPK